MVLVISVKMEHTNSSQIVLASSLALIFTTRMMLNIFVLNAILAALLVQVLMLKTVQLAPPLQP